MNKVRLTNKHEVIEIESWVNFDSKNNSYDEQISPPSMIMKEESAYSKCERIK